MGQERLSDTIFCITVDRVTIVCIIQFFAELIMSPEFYSRWKFHYKLGFLMLAVMQAFFSCLFLRFNLLSIKGAVLLLSFVVYMALIVTLKLHDLYSRNSYSLIKTEVLLVVALGLAFAVILCITEGVSAIPFVMVECLLTIIIYVLWMRIMRLWLKRHFCPHQYVCVADDDNYSGDFMELDSLDGNIFSSAKYFNSDDDQDITDYMQLFKVGIMAITSVSLDTYRNMLNICHKFNAMAFLTEKPQLPEYESSIREVYIGGRKLWLYLPLN